MNNSKNKNENHTIADQKNEPVETGKCTSQPKSLLVDGRSKALTTSALQRFQSTMDRCKKILTLHDSNCCEPELLRLVVVLAVSGFDMYAADRFAEAFIPFVKGRDLTPKDDEFFTEIGLNARGAIEIMKSSPKRPLRGIRRVVDEYLSHTAMQSERGINKLYRFYGFTQFLDDVFAPKKRRQKTKTERKTKIAKDFTDMIQRRHQIVHNADYDGKYHVQSIEVKTVEKWLASLQETVKRFETRLAARFAKQKKRKRTLGSINKE